MPQFEVISNWYLACFPNEQDAHIKAMFYYRDAYMLCGDTEIKEALQREVGIVNIIIPGNKANNRIFMDALKICGLPQPSEE